MMRLRCSLPVLGVLLLLTVPVAMAQPMEPGDYGDAPEDAIAYPSLGTFGLFPTCLGGPAAGYVYHTIPGGNPILYFGQLVDAEPDGNAGTGTCVFPPYDQDECMSPVDADAGLMLPDAYTIQGGVEVLCSPQGTGVPLGTPCALAAWGTDIDILVINQLPETTYVNILMDWNQDGQWGGSSQCGGPAPEWALANYPVPGFFGGPLSMLAPPPILIGPNAGYVWARFTVTRVPLTAPEWDGSGEFEYGESEDYLLRIEPEPQYGECGDAPEDAIAYPFLGITGLFPTCLAGTTGYIFHHQQPAPALFLGPSIDYELDGNAGTCPPPPYEQDECCASLDNDAGLLIPDGYTIVGNSVQLCDPQALGRPLGATCNPASWGANLDVQVTNIFIGEAYLNVTMDWSQDGRWGGWVECPGVGQAPEWVLVNFPVPAGFTGPLSMLTPPGFLIGPYPGHVWTRFTLSETPILQETWDGSGEFELGETEDYLLRVDGEPPEGDYGDAPEGGMAYPPLGVGGQFPTCVTAGPAGFIRHTVLGRAWFGPLADPEFDGNAGSCVFPQYDQDECGMAGGDAGLVRPEPFTRRIPGGYIPCPGGQGSNVGWSCIDSHWGANLDVFITNSDVIFYYVNILMDWDQNGLWAGSMQCPDMRVQPEHLLVNLPVPPGFGGLLSQLIAGPFLVPADPGHVWARFTISETPVPDNWDGSGVFEFGETEDYLLAVYETQAGVGENHPPAGRLGLVLEPGSPNPFYPRTTVAFALGAPGPVRLTISDVAGRAVRTLVDEPLPAGRHQRSWDGCDDRGATVGSGIYFIRVEAGGVARSTKVMKLK